MTPLRIPRLSFVARWALLTLAVLCVGALFWLVSITAFDKDSSLFARWLLLLTATGAIIAALVTSDFRFRRTGLVKSILEPRNVAILFLAALTAFGATTDAVNLFLPRPVVESRPGKIEEDVGATRKAVEALVPPKVGAPAVLSKLRGNWGEQEPECGLVWHIAIKGESLTAEIVRRPPGVAPYRLVARITAAKGNSLDFTGEEPAAARGSAARLTYSFDGATERLVWDDQKRATDLQEYRRCP